MNIRINFKLGGFATILSIVFAALKLMGVVEWSWFIVLLPMIIGIGLTILLFIAMIIFTTLMIPKDIRKKMKDDF